MPHKRKINADNTLESHWPKLWWLAHVRNSTQPPKHDKRLVPSVTGKKLRDVGGDLSGPPRSNVKLSMRRFTVLGMLHYEVFLKRATASPPSPDAKDASGGGGGGVGVASGLGLSAGTPPRDKSSMHPGGGASAGGDAGMVGVGLGVRPAADGSYKVSQVMSPFSPSPPSLPLLHPPSQSRNRAQSQSKEPPPPADSYWWTCRSERTDWRRRHTALCRWRSHHRSPLRSCPNHGPRPIGLAGYSRLLVARRSAPAPLHAYLWLLSVATRHTDQEWRGLWLVPRLKTIPGPSSQGFPPQGDRRARRCWRGVCKECHG